MNADFPSVSTLVPCGEVRGMECVQAKLYVHHTYILLCMQMLQATSFLCSFRHLCTYSFVCASFVVQAVSTIFWGSSSFNYWSLLHVHTFTCRHTTHMHTHIHTHAHTQHTYTLTCTHTCTHIHIHIHTHIHTWTIYLFCVCVCRLQA